VQVDKAVLKRIYGKCGLAEMSAALGDAVNLSIGHHRPARHWQSFWWWRITSSMMNRKNFSENSGSS
jgi:hypothetical protein